MDLQLPALELNGPLGLILFWTGMISTAGALFISLVLINEYDFSKYILISPVLGGFLTYFISLLLNPFRIHFADSTVRQLTQHTLGMNNSKIILKWNFPGGDGIGDESVDQ